MNVIEFPLTKVGIEGKCAAIELRMRKDEAINEMVVHLVTQIIRKCQHNEVAKLSVSVPATWWQHFKHDHFRGWLLKRFPVRYIIVEKMYSVDLELVALPDYEHIKHIAAHQPFIRTVIREQFPTMFCDGESGCFTKSDLFSHTSLPPK